MNIVHIFLLKVLVMECLTLAIPFVETQSWIRRRPSFIDSFKKVKRDLHSSNEDSVDCLDCLASSSSSSSEEYVDERGSTRAFNKAKLNCTGEREERRRIAQATRSSDYIPTCRRNGSYTPVQCHRASRTCWCVTNAGSHIPGTSVLNKKPDCSKYRDGAKATTQRRSSLRKNNRKLCTHIDRATFNSALIEKFRSEFNRIRTITNTYSRDARRSDAVSDVLAWKFQHLDTNRDNYLHRNETLTLKQLVKLQIKPRQCAKTFISYCAKGDKKITRSEWVECLQIDRIESLPFDTFNSLVGSAGTSGGLHPLHMLQPVGPLSSDESDFVPPLLDKSSSMHVIEVSNCWTDRNSALASQKLDGGGKSVIIPECTITGQFQRTQCAHGKAYCWCVNEVTGAQIPDTVVVNARPNCDRPMRAGCLGKRKDRFLIDLMESFTKIMQDAGVRHLNSRRFRNASVDEETARWHFQRLDKNQNSLVDRQEWKVFRAEVSQDKKLKRCGKKLPRQCDVNKDRKITISEWFDCLKVKHDNSTAKRTIQRSNGPRSGKNPFTNILQR